MGEPLIVAPIAVALDSVRVPTVSTREGGDTSPFLGVSNNSNSSSFRYDIELQQDRCTHPLQIDSNQIEN